MDVAGIENSFMFSVNFMKKADFLATLSFNRIFSDEPDIHSPMPKDVLLPLSKNIILKV